MMLTQMAAIEQLAHNFMLQTIDKDCVAIDKKTLSNIDLMITNLINLHCLFNFDNLKQSFQIFKNTVSNMTSHPTEDFNAAKKFRDEIINTKNKMELFFQARTAFPQTTMLQLDISAVMQQLNLQ